MTHGVGKMEVASARNGIDVTREATVYGVYRGEEVTSNNTTTVELYELLQSPEFISYGDWIRKEDNENN